MTMAEQIERFIVLGRLRGYDEPSGALSAQSIMNLIHARKLTTTVQSYSWASAASEDAWRTVFEIIREAKADPERPDDLAQLWKSISKGNGLLQGFWKID